MDKQTKTITKRLRRTFTPEFKADERDRGIGKCDASEMV